MGELQGADLTKPFDDIYMLSCFLKLTYLLYLSNILIKNDYYKEILSGTN